MGKKGRQYFRSMWGSCSLSTHEKVRILVWIVILLSIRIALGMLLSPQENEFYLEAVWSLSFLPAVLGPFCLGLPATIIFASLFWALGVIVEGTFLVLTLISRHHFFLNVIVLTSISLVTAIIGLFLERLKKEQAAINSLGQSMALIEERYRLGRELHDTLAQTLPTLKLKLLTAMREFDRRRPEEGLVLLKELEDILRHEIVNTRCVIADFKCEISAEKKMHQIIYDCADKARRYYGLEIEVRMPEELLIDCSLEIKSHLVRIVQEALTNIRKHSRTDKACICLNYQSELLYIEIKDYGVGFDMSTASQFQHGLVTMKERAKLINADLEIYSRPQQGTSVTVRLPLEFGEVKKNGEEKSIGCG